MRTDVDPLILHAWLSARSISRGLPPPVSEHGGFRIDTNSKAEIARWVFPKMGSGLEHLARTINKPRYLLKLCGTAEALRAALTEGWNLHAPSYFMQATGMPGPKPLPDGYKIEITQTGHVWEARILSETGTLAASGYAVEIQGVFIYDRIGTELEHRRKGLGRALMQTLHQARQHRSGLELLVATEDGRALYESLGWKTISPYSTASIICPGL
ncbi:hypothetical protein GCM10008941_12150 [Rhizomicrobium palustre]